MIVFVEKVQVQADEVHFLPFKTRSESIVILSTYTVYCRGVNAKTFGWASMILLSHLSFAQYEQVKFRPKNKVKMTVSHSVVAVGTVCVCVCVCVYGGVGVGEA